MPQTKFPTEIRIAKPGTAPAMRLATPIAVVAVLAVGQGAALLSLLVISHACSAEVFGQLSTGLAIQNYVVLAGTLGLRTLVVRDSLGKQIYAMAVVAVTELAFLVSLQAGWIDFNVTSLGRALALKWGAASLLQATLLFWITKPIHWRFSSTLFDRWRRAAGPMLATSLLMNLPISGAVVLARSFQNAADAAPIGLAGQLAGAVILLAGVAVRFIQPMWRDRNSLHDLDTFRRVLAMGSVGLAGWFALVLAITIVSWTLLPMEYVQGIGAIYLCLLAAAFGVVARVLWVALVAAERELRVMWAYGIGCVVFVAVSLLSAPGLGAIGCAIGAAVGTASTTLIMWRSVRDMFPRGG